MGEIVAGVVAGMALAVCGVCLAIAAGGISTAAVVRVARRLAPRERRQRSREHCAPAFDCYYHRQRELEELFAERLELRLGQYPDEELVLAIHDWELGIILDMPQVQRGRLYGRYDIVEWTVQDCDIIVRTDRRLREYKLIRDNGNGMAH